MKAVTRSSKAEALSISNGLVKARSTGQVSCHQKKHYIHGPIQEVTCSELNDTNPTPELVRVPCRALNHKLSRDLESRVLAYAIYIQLDNHVQIGGRICKYIQNRSRCGCGKTSAVLC